MNVQDSSVYMSDGYCVNVCNSQYAFAVIQGQDCWCSNAAPGNQVDTAYCNYPCPGYPSDPCGNVTDNLYAYFNLNRAASSTVGGVAGPTSSDAGVATSSSLDAGASSTTDAATTDTSSAPSTTSDTPSSTTSFTATDTSAIEQYIRTALAAAAIVSVATEACFVNQAYSSYTTPAWFVAAPTQVQSYYSSVNLGSTAGCAPSASQTAGAATATNSGSHSGLSAGAKAGIAIGAILGALLIAALIVFAVIWSRRRRHREEEHVADTAPSEKSSFSPYPAYGAGTHSAPNDARSNYGSEQPIYPDEERVISPQARSAAQGAWQNHNRAPVAVLHESAAPGATTANDLVTGGTLAAAADRRRNQSFERAVAAHGTEPGSNRSSEYGTPPDGSRVGGNERYGDMQHDFPVPPRPQQHQNAFALQQQNPYQMHPNWAQGASNDGPVVARKPIGGTNRPVELHNTDMTALPTMHDPQGSQYSHSGNIPSEQQHTNQTFYDDNDDEYYPYHAR